MLKVKANNILSGELSYNDIDREKLIEFGEKFHSILHFSIEKKITQERLSKEVGISRQTLSKLENGKIHKFLCNSLLNF